MEESIFAFEVEAIDGEKISLSRFKGKALLIVNTASRCGFTKQYSELEQIYQLHKPDGLEILAFPCNQFGQQEPGTNEEIALFCETNFKISFPLFAKVDVNGDKAHPLFQFLKKNLPGVLGSQAIKWNFTKFFVDQKGRPLRRFAPTERPVDVMKELKSYL